MSDLQTKCCPRPSALGNILSSGPTYHMLPSSPVNNSIIYNSVGPVLNLPLSQRAKREKIKRGEIFLVYSNYAKQF